jgi:hypothetical protein
MTPEQKAAWLRDKIGKLSASCMADAMDFTKAGKPGARRIALIRRLIAERMIGDNVENVPPTARMLRGLELEPQGKGEYELRTGNVLIPCGFVEHPAIPDFGATSDALVVLPHGRATWEMKAPDTTTHIEYMEAGNEVPERYVPQVLAQCACNQVEHVVFVSYDPRVLNSRKRMHIVEWTPGRERIEEVEQAARDFLRELEARWELIHSDEKEAA